MASSSACHRPPYEAQEELGGLCPSHNVAEVSPIFPFYMLSRQAGGLHPFLVLVDGSYDKGGDDMLS